MSLFVLACWTLCLLTFVLLVYWGFEQRSSMVRPSFLLVVFFHLQVQVASTIHAHRIELLLKHPWDFFLLSQVFPLAVLIGSASFFVRRSQIAFRYAMRWRIGGWAPWPYFALPASACVLVTIWYLSEVPWQQTGLHAALAEPGQYLEKRDEAFKLLENMPLRYAFAGMQTVLAPILAVLLAMGIECALRRRRFGQVLLALGAVLALVVAVSLPGARGPGARLALAMVFTVFLVRGFPLRPVKLLTLAAIVFLIPVLLSLTRKGVAITPSSLVHSYINVADRAFNRNMEPAVWAVDYVHRHGYFGVEGIPKLASALGKRPVYVFNVVGREKSRNPNVSANMPFVFAYYACFGLAILPLCLAGALLLDLMLLTFRPALGEMLVPCISSSAIAVMKFIQSFYTTALLSGGFLLIPAVCWFLVLTVNPRFRQIWLHRLRSWSPSSETSGLKTVPRDVSKS